MFDVHKTTEQFIEEAQNKFDKAVKERDVPHSIVPQHMTPKDGQL